jgi:hypothetical protein
MGIMFRRRSWMRRRMTEIETEEEEEKEVGIEIQCKQKIKWRR